jgi:hypothetical protein
MKEYHKIHTLWKRDSATKHRTLVEDSWSLPEFEYLHSNQWLFTEKVDGTNIRIMPGLRFSGKTDNSQIPTKLLMNLMDMFDASLLEEMLGANFCLYGEGYGPGIGPMGKLYRSDQTFILFDVMINGWWLRWPDVEDVAYKLNLTYVPVVGSGTLDEAIEMTRAGFDSLIAPGVASEGLVVRPVVDMLDRSGQRIIGKIKHKDFKH